MTNKIYEELDRLITKYCTAKNLCLDSYYQGIFSDGPINDQIVTKLIEYHKDWLKNIH